mmetsp:Transcript_2094/g.6158  ORF Transcript_2094/g.6158 Transcript_2094/m.6158 type:complete len:358 (-) Transcript_2094:2176-3249(-)
MLLGLFASVASFLPPVHLPEATMRTASGTALHSHSPTMRVLRLATVSSSLTRVLSWVTMGPLPAPAAGGMYTVQPVTQAPCSRAWLTASATVALPCSREARTTRSLSSHLRQKAASRTDTSKSSSTTTSCAWFLASASSSSPSTCEPPPLQTTASMPAAFACASSGLAGDTPTTMVTSAGKAGTSVDSSSARRGVTDASPPTTTTRVRETVHRSCSEESTPGNGIETPSSGSISQLLSAPRMHTCSSPSGRRASSPTTRGSSCRPFISCMAAGTSSFPTTSTMPMPQLKVATISWQGISNFQAIQRNTAGSSHLSARSCAWSSFGSARGTPRRRPPLVIGAAPLSCPAFASASTACE